MNEVIQTQTFFMSYADNMALSFPNDMGSMHNHATDFWILCALWMAAAS